MTTMLWNMAPLQLTPTTKQLFPTPHKTIEEYNGLKYNVQNIVIELYNILTLKAKGLAA